jgi:putative transposase
LLVSLWRSSFQYRALRKDDDELKRRMRVIAEKRRRFGCPRIQVMLEREGWKVNHKKVERIYKEEGLALRRRKHRKKFAGLRVPLPVASRPNEHWAMDFVQDRLASGRKFRTLTIEDTFSRECPAIEVDTSLGGIRVVRVLDRLAQERGLPESITVDNGTEFDSKAVDEWAFKHGVKIDFIHPGKPNENAYIESFNGRFREECLNEHIFETLDEAREIIEEWRQDYNDERPHSSLENLTPTEFVQKHYALLNGSTVTATASVG